MKILNPIKLFNQKGHYYIATLQFDEPVVVRGVSVIEAPWGGYLAMAPKMLDGKGEWKSVIKWQTSKAHKLVYEAVEAGDYYKLETPSPTNLGNKIGYAKIEIPCSVDVAVFVDSHGTPYLRLPGRVVTEINEDGKEVKKTAYYINIAEGAERERIAKEIIEASKK